jgi:hypothetical protein
MSNLEHECLAAVALTNPSPPNARNSKHGRIPNACHSERSEESPFDVLDKRRRDSSLRGLRSKCRFQLNFATH